MLYVKMAIPCPDLSTNFSVKFQFQTEPGSQLCVIPNEYCHLPSAMLMAQRMTQEMAKICTMKPLIAAVGGKHPKNE